MASSYSGYKPLSTIADVDVKGPGQYKDISDLTGYENTTEELRSYFLNRRTFPTLYPASSFILLLGDPGICRYSLVSSVCDKMGMQCMQVCLPPEVDSSYSGGKKEMMEYYLKQAKEVSEEKDVILYFDEAELGLINELSADIPPKITLVGAAGSSANLDNDLLSKVSKYINIPPPPLSERIRFIKSKMAEAQFTNKIKDNEMEFIGQETEKYSFRDLERLWCQSCDISLSHLRNHAGELDDQDHGEGVVMCQQYEGVPCTCEVTCKPVEERVDESDSKKMEMTGEMMIRALSAVRTAVHHDMISEEEYIKKYADFSGKRDDTIGSNRNYNTNPKYNFVPSPDESNKNAMEDEDDGCPCKVYLVLGGCAIMTIVFIVGMIVLLTMKRPTW